MSEQFVRTPGILQTARKPKVDRGGLGGEVHPPSRNICASASTVHRSGVRVDGLVGVSLDLDEDSLELASVSLQGTTLQITGIQAGAATLLASRNSPADGKGITTFPEVALRGELSVTILPA